VVNLNSSKERYIRYDDEAVKRALEEGIVEGAEQWLYLK
jgi:hypothetical protein